MGRPFNNSWPSANPKFHGPFNPRAEFPRNFTDSPSRNDRSHAVQQSQDHQGGSFQRKRWRGKRNRNWNGDWHGNQNRRNQHSSGWTSKDLELRLLAQPIQPSDLVTFDRIEIDAQGDVIMTDAPQAQTSSFNDHADMLQIVAIKMMSCASDLRSLSNYINAMEQRLFLDHCHPPSRV